MLMTSQFAQHSVKQTGVPLFIFNFWLRLKNNYMATHCLLLLFALIATCKKQKFAVETTPELLLYVV